MPLPSPQELMGKILIKNKKSHKPPNSTDTKRLTDQPANPSNEPVSPSNNTGGKTPQQRGLCSAASSVSSQAPCPHKYESPPRWCHSFSFTSEETQEGLSKYIYDNMLTD